MLKPGGRAPETSTNSYGGQPARATNWKLYGVPTLPLGGKTLSSKPNLGDRRRDRRDCSDNQKNTGETHRTPLLDYLRCGPESWRFTSI